MRAELASHPSQCTLAYWHQPPWSSTASGGVHNMRTIWADLANAGVELVLTAHFHHYERFADLNASGQPVAGGAGLREIIAGHRRGKPGKLRGPDAGARVPGADRSATGSWPSRSASGSYSWQYRQVGGAQRTRAPRRVTPDPLRPAGACVGTSGRPPSARLKARTSRVSPRDLGSVTPEAPRRQLGDAIVRSQPDDRVRALLHRAWCLISSQLRAHPAGAHRGDERTLVELGGEDPGERARSRSSSTCGTPAPCRPSRRAAPCPTRRSRSEAAQSCAGDAAARPG